MSIDVIILAVRGVALQKYIKIRDVSTDGNLRIWRIMQPL